MIDFIKIIADLSAEDNGVLGISVVRDNSYHVFVRNDNFSPDDLYRVAKQAKQVRDAYSHTLQWEIPMPATEAEKLVLESNLYLLCLKVLGKTESKA